MGTLRYFPLTRVTPNLYTNGEQYATEDGIPYAGRYYKLYNNEAYTGTDPVTGTNKKLYPREFFRRGAGIQSGFDIVPYYNITGNRPVGDISRASVEEGALTELRSYYPIPIDSDYERGYFTRYFAKTVSGPGYVFEISPTDWTKIQNGDIAAENILGYESIDMLWQLTGPLEDTRVSQYQIKGGVLTTNRRVTIAKDRVFSGLFQYIGEDYTKFAKITPQ